MTLIRFYLNWVRSACRHSLDRAQSILFVATALTGLAAAFTPPMLRPLLPDMTAWQAAGLVVGAIVALRLLLAPYWLWRAEHDLAAKAQSALAARLGNLEAIKASPTYLRLKILLGPASALSPETRLNTATTEFAKLVEQAEDGDIESASIAIHVAEWYLEVARRYYGSSTGFFDIQTEVLGCLERLSKRYP